MILGEAPLSHFTRNVGQGIDDALVLYSIAPAWTVSLGRGSIPNLVICSAGYDFPARFCFGYMIRCVCRYYPLESDCPLDETVASGSDPRADTTRKRRLRHFQFPSDQLERRSSGV